MLGVLELEIEQVLEKLRADHNGKAVDDGVVERGGQGVGVQVNRVMKSCHTIDVGF